MADAEMVDRVEKQLNHHLNNRKCESCTVKGKSYADCFDNLFTDALDVIRELKAENERLKKHEAMSVDSFVQWCIDSHMIGDATLNGIKYWVEKFKEGR